MGAKIQKNPQTAVKRFTDSFTNFTEVSQLSPLTSQFSTLTSQRLRVGEQRSGMAPYFLPIALISLVSASN